MYKYDETLVKAVSDNLFPCVINSDPSINFYDQ